PVGTEQRPREQSRRGRLADPAWAGEEIGVGDAPRPQRVAQGARDRVLADDGLERLWAPLPSEHLVGHRFACRHAPVRKRGLPMSKRVKVAVHPPSNGPHCDLFTEPAPVRYSHGTREGRLTVAPFRAWRGSTILVAWGPTFNAVP